MSLLLAAGAAAPPADLSAGDWPWGFEAEEDQWPDLLESGPVVADVAVVASQPPEDAWNWTADDVDLVVIPGGYAQPYISETPLGDDDEFPWWDNTDDAWWDYLNSNDGRDNAVFDAATDHDWDWDDALEPGFFPGARQQQDAPNQPPEAEWPEEGAEDESWVFQTETFAEQLDRQQFDDDDWDAETEGHFNADQPVANDDQPQDDAWPWLHEEDSEAEDSAEQSIGPDASTDQPVDDIWVWEEDADEWQLDEPIGPDAPPDQPPADEWDWDGGDVQQTIIPTDQQTTNQPELSKVDDWFDDQLGDPWEDWLNADDIRENATAAADQPTDAGIDEDAADDAWPDFLAEQIGADAVADQPPEAAWLEEEVDDWAPENDQIGADAINALPDDAWLWIDEVEDQAPADDGVGADAVFDQPTQDEWDWSGEVDDDFLESPVIDDGAMPAELSVDEEPVEDWWPEADPIGADALVDLASAEAWEWALEQEDDQRVEDEPIGADEPPLFVDAWPWGSADDTDDWWPEEAVIGPDEPPLFVDGWPWESADDTDDPPPPDEPIGADEPPLFVDGWYWDEEPAGNDDWWAECPYILEDRQESLTYTQDWDWVEDDTSDDDWWQWREEPQFDNVDLCPIFLAEAMARIAELEALLAAERGKSGGGGGEGEDYFRTRYRWATRDERIRRNNALILALVGAVVHGLDKPEEPTK